MYDAFRVQASEVDSRKMRPVMTTSPPQNYKLTFTLGQTFITVRITFKKQDSFRFISNCDQKVSF